MKIIGKKSFGSMISRIFILVIAVFVACFFSEICLTFYNALLFTKDQAVIAEYGALMEKYTYSRFSRRGGIYISPTIITIIALAFIAEALITLATRLTQPQNIIECDEKGFYLHLPFNKSWYVLYEEIVGIRVSRFDGPVHVKKRNANWFFYDPDDYIEIDTARTMGPKTTGTITVHIRDKAFKISGVKNALSVSREMKRICNDGKRRHFEWLEKKAAERRELELREKTKT